MALYSVPFYPSLLNKEVNGLTLTTKSVLLIGAIIAHSNGRFDCCFASASVLAAEVGSNEKQVKDLRSKLISAGIVEVLERDRSNYIISMRVNSELVARLLGENDEERGCNFRTPFLKNRKPFPKKQETVTEVVTEVGETILKEEEEEVGNFEPTNQNQDLQSPHLQQDHLPPQGLQDPHLEQGAESPHQELKMNPKTLTTKIRSIFVRAQGKSPFINRKRCEEGVAKLQEELKDEEILTVAKAMAYRPHIFYWNKNDTSWKPDFYWFTSPDKTDKVLNSIAQHSQEIFNPDSETKSANFFRFEGI